MRELVSTVEIWKAYFDSFVILKKINEGVP